MLNILEKGLCLRVERRALVDIGWCLLHFI